MLMRNFLALIPSKIRKKYEKFIRKRMDARIPEYLGMSPRTAFSDQDVFIVGYPKSGNTWFQNLISGLVFGVDPELAPDALIQEIVPDLHRKRFYKRIREQMFFKSHHLPRPEYRKVIYLLRDGRDVMVSYYHYNKAIYGDSADMDLMIESGQFLFPCQWQEHVRQWRKNAYGADMITVKYEDLLHDPWPELEKVCRFVGLERSPATLRTVYDQCSFKALRRKEQTAGLDDPTWPRDKAFFRRGKHGSHKDEMSARSLRKFLAVAGKTLRECGYIDTDS